MSRRLRGPWHLICTTASPAAIHFRAFSISPTGIRNKTWFVYLCSALGFAALLRAGVCVVWSPVRVLVDQPVGSTPFCGRAAHRHFTLRTTPSEPQGHGPKPLNVINPVDCFTVQIRLSGAPFCGGAVCLWPAALGKFTTFPLASAPVVSVMQNLVLCTNASVTHAASSISPPLHKAEFRTI